MKCFVFKGIEFKKNASEMRLRICSDEYSQNIISSIQIPWFYKLSRIKTKFKIMKFKIERSWISYLIMELFKNWNIWENKRIWICCKFVINRFKLTQCLIGWFLLHALKFIASGVAIANCRYETMRKGYMRWDGAIIPSKKCFI